VLLEFNTQIKRLQDKMAQISGPETLEKFIREIGQQESSAASVNGVEVSLGDSISNEQLAHEIMWDPVFYFIFYITFVFSFITLLTDVPARRQGLHALRERGFQHHPRVVP
jgi:hypothetical protein